LKKIQIICNKIETINYIKIIYITNKMSKCEHGKRKSRCIDCGGKDICEHKKYKYSCKECGGKGICQHGREKYSCKECGGKRFCQHNREKQRCKECGGSQICEHGKDKSICKECGGSQICEHNIQKQRCKECGGSQICEHNKIISTCKECGGTQICKHNKRIQLCRDCHGSIFCVHDKQKARCKECGGSQICEHGKEKRYCKDCNEYTKCEHGKEKYRCKDCGGSQICEHNKRKEQCIICSDVLCEHNKRKQVCVECGGSQICEHNKVKTRCKLCGGSALCKTPFCESRYNPNPKYQGHCVYCFIHLFPDEPNTRNYKTKEKDVVDRITKTFNNFTWVADKKVQDGCSKRRPDLLLDMGSHIIIMEVDENKHTDYDCSCEHKRLMELSQDLQHRPIIFIRFNPDDYTNQEGVLVKSCWKLNKLGVMQITKTKQKEWEERIEALKHQIQYWIDNPTEKTIEIVELFY